MLLIYNMKNIQYEKKNALDKGLFKYLNIYYKISLLLNKDINL
jgi:hypothetical protein